MPQNKITSLEKKRLKSEYDKIYHAKNRKKRLAYHAEWRAANKGRLDQERREAAAQGVVSQRWAEYYAKNRERILAKNRAKYSANPEEHRQRAKDYARKNAEKVARRMTAWRASNQDKTSTQRAEYVKRPRSRAAKILSEKERRARKQGCEVRATKKQVAEFMYSAKECFYCRRSGMKLTLDHFVPLRRRGAHSLENFRAACGSCNSKKKDRDPVEFLASLGELALTA